MCRLTRRVMLSHLKPHRWAVTVAVVPLLIERGWCAAARRSESGDAALPGLPCRAPIREPAAAEPRPPAPRGVHRTEWKTEGAGRSLRLNLAGVRLTLKENAAAVRAARRALCDCRVAGCRLGP